MNLVVECQQENPHPHCPHGPTLFFYRDPSKKDGYFACAVHRDKKQCNFKLSQKDKLTEKILSRRYDAEAQEEAKLYTLKRKEVFESIQKGETCHYCIECSLLILQAELHAHSTHRIYRNIDCNALQDPTQFLPPLNDDKTEAQYFFDTNALKYFVQCFRDLEIQNIICIGAPRLHAYIRNKCNDLKSFLLDLDKRYLNFFHDNEFAWYSMCNNHFFLSKHQQAFEQFVRSSPVGRLLIFTDPPYGVRTEPIAYTLRQLSELHTHLHDIPYAPLPIFWIFPYFAAQYIQNVMPELLMCDYKVNYSNHLVYTNIGAHARKLGSPVRIFTNVPLTSLKIPKIEKNLYRNCAKCQRYVAIENTHCDKCACCPSVNGATYRHCVRCGNCVKSNYKHCTDCRRCVQNENHDCSTYQKKQQCRICLQRGHIETQCESWWQRNHHSRNLVNTCFLCCSSKHNERKCPKRQIYIDEYTFLGESVVKKFK